MMDPAKATISVSKGCFVFKNGATKTDNRRKKSKSQPVPLLGNEITSQLFYTAYSKAWKSIKESVECLQKDCYTRTLQDLLEYVRGEYKEEANLQGILPTVALLTGINQPDHSEQFETLSQHINEILGDGVRIVRSRDCPNIKSAIENIVYGFVEKPVDDVADLDNKRLRRAQCTMQVLEAWYNASYLERDKRIVIILPDFECFHENVLHDLILILCSYCSRLPIVLILGVATAVSAVHSTLPYHVTSKMKLKIFQTQPAPVELNEILEKVVLSPKHTFHLSGKCFKFLTHIFLFYDFSLSGFVQCFKYCLMEHFFQGNAYALCNDFTESLDQIDSLSHEDIESIRHLLSFRPYVESLSSTKTIDILTKDEYFKKELRNLLRKCHLYFKTFRCSLELFTALVDDLPKTPFGKHCREIYPLCLSKDIVEHVEFKECWQILSFMSKKEFVSKISKAIKITEEFMDRELSSDEISIACKELVTDEIDKLKVLLTKVVVAETEIKQMASAQSKYQVDLKSLNRFDLKEKLLEMTKQEKPISDFTNIVTETLNFIRDNILRKFLRPLSCAPPLHELFVFSDISIVRRNIIGAPRAALHMALNDPNFYLQCKCCKLDVTGSLMPTLPDLSVAYKLHLESGRMINLFDWMQAFRSVVDYSEEETEQIDPNIQARFTRSVAELQFLGYIKTSKRKTDHVTRLTW